MTRSFQGESLSANEVAPLLPLVQATWPDVDLPTWRKFVDFYCGAQATKGSGILRFNDGGGVFCGVLAYRVEHDLHVGLVLCIHMFTAVDLANSAELVTALIDAAESEAALSRCSYLQIRLTDSQNRLASRIRRLGLSESAGCFWKKVRPA
ncbi:MAG TPA: hypothetical protein VEU47_06460 [Candidatus Cybelea sp.]|nr:hypothetical protein [Candidatus Cybelea sp.]